MLFFGCKESISKTARKIPHSDDGETSSPDNKVLQNTSRKNLRKSKNKNQKLISELFLL